MVRRENIIRAKKFVISYLILLTFSLSHLLTLTSCGGGDDDGHRLGELIVGTWQRGWGEGDVIIEGDTQWQPSDFSYDLFIFRDGGSYNGMVRDGAFTALDEFGEVIYEGDYRCDNNNLRLTFNDESGQKQTLLMRVLSFSEDTIKLQYDNEEYGITVTMIIRRYSSVASAS